MGRPLPSLFVNAMIEKVRDGGRVQRKCVVVAHAVHESGRREIIGLDVGAADAEAFWREFPRERLSAAIAQLQRRPRKLAATLEEAEEHILAL